MNPRRLFSIIQKELRQLTRDRQSLRMFIIAPVIQLLMFGYAVTSDLKGAQLGVIMEEPSPQARRLVQAIMQTRAFDLARQSASPGDARGWLDRGEAQIILDIPAGFSRAVSQGSTPVVQVLSDGSDSNTATLAFQYLSGAAAQWAGQERMEGLRRHPERMVRWARAPQVQLESRYWYNPSLKSVNFQVPGVLTLLLMVLMVTQTSLMVVREREVGTLEQLSVTPLRGGELLVGKTIPIFGVGVVLAVLVSLVATLWFRVPLRGSVPFLAFSIAIYLLNTMGMGLMLSIVSRTQLQAQLTSNFIITPMIMLSGFLFPIANMPPWAQAITYALPTRYFMEIVRGVFLKGQGAADLWPQAAALAVLGTLLYLGGILLYRKRID